MITAPKLLEEALRVILSNLHVTTSSSDFDIASKRNPQLMDIVFERVKECKEKEFVLDGERSFTDFVSDLNNLSDELNMDDDDKDDQKFDNAIPWKLIALMALSIVTFFVLRMSSQEVQHVIKSSSIECHLY